MTFSITVLGSSGTYPGAGLSCSGYLLRTATTAVWLDCGSGSLANLQRHVALDDIDGIVCTHEHPDHWTDLSVAANALRYVLDRPDGRLPLLWTAGTAAMFAAVTGRSGEGTFDPVVIDETSTATIGDIDFTFSRTDHPVETLAVRADHAGRTLVYSADTGNRWDLAGLAAPGPIDLAVVEASMDEEQADAVAHLTAMQAGSQATRAGVARLMLTHLVPGADPAQRLADAAVTFDGPISVAEPNATHPI